ncbi:ATP-binding protein [Ideonella azotifigens]|uniref:NadR/Ttd14 AAA domain-containing protein n=2 Tax=Ideonella azotifigens TaxID=513160 RepID=A0ABN1KHZ3_9BURK|nr:ATP-binding protein [Ideonella azotifigens]MCD2344144.1 ATP-binding protein [Ideonella azotifigens]
MPEQQQTGRVIALVGAESTGKSTLAAALAPRVAELTGWPCTWVPEYLREWCDAQGRTPREAEQEAIALEQARRIELAAATHAVVLADTTPLMTAVYHRQVFGSQALDAMALAWQRRCALTLLTALDLPWEPDGLQRDGPQVRAPVDNRLRELLVGAGLAFAVVSGSGPRRLEAALDAMVPVLRLRRAPRTGLLTRLQDRDAAQPAWLWACDSCDQPDCEHTAFQQRIRTAGSLQRS